MSTKNKRKERQEIRFRRRGGYDSGPEEGFQEDGTSKSIEEISVDNGLKRRNKCRNSRKFQREEGRVLLGRLRQPVAL